MVKNINTKINQLAMDRQEDIGVCLRNNNEYMSLDRDLSNLFKEIINSLPEDKKNLIYTFEEKTTEQSNIAEVELYKQGLRDGMQLNLFALGKCI